MKIRVKITALFTLLVTALLLLLSGSVFYFSKVERRETFKNRITARANINTQIYSIVGDTNLAALARFDSSSTTIPEKSVTIYNQQNSPIYQYNARGADTIHANVDILNDARVQKRYYFNDGEKEAVAFNYEDEYRKVVIVVGGYDEDGWTRLRKLQNMLLASLATGIMLTLVVGHVFSQQLVRPISQIIHEVNEISSQNLSHRIHAGSSQDELNQLSNTFNELLNRLQESFLIQRRFISNASHELSTPLTSILSQLEVTLHKDRTLDEYKQVMQSIHEDVRQMQQLTKSLLEIAKTGSQGSIELVEVRIDEVLLKVTADVQKISEQYNVDLNFGDFPEDEKSFMVFGSGDLLYSAIKNVVENGCKYSPDHVSVVNLSFPQNKVVIEVKNKGDVIAEEEIENIFQPFYRSGNIGQAKGFGLGLALAKRIISLHKGTIDVQSDIITGTVFTITLPSMGSSEVF
ncbi:MAG: HAMP domain-containing histidine kinase [Chitinophagaceae bacterium]|nr:MAG: HAMP domain-containing histidine kinase [Chitinophagaceae bacterium]